MNRQEISNALQHEIADEDLAYISRRRRDSLAGQVYFVFKSQSIAVELLRKLL